MKGKALRLKDHFQIHQDKETKWLIWGTGPFIVSLLLFVTGCVAGGGEVILVGVLLWFPSLIWGVIYHFLIYSPYDVDLNISNNVADGWAKLVESDAEWDNTSGTNYWPTSAEILKMFQRHIEDDAYQDKTFFGYSLLLRPFEFDSSVKFSEGQQNEHLFSILGRDQKSFEKKLAESLFEVLPLVAVDNKISQSGPSAVTLSEDDWKDKVRHLIRDAAVIFAIPYPGDGLRWEIEQIAQMGLLPKVIFVVPPGGLYPSGSRPPEVRTEEDFFVSLALNFRDDREDAAMFSLDADKKVVWKHVTDLFTTSAEVEFNVHALHIEQNRIVLALRSYLRAALLKNPVSTSLKPE
ncbi:hypothetical protein [Ruegeria hyattellae]|uniref:hypothetical protein n=1 Tax=Ruegeria hyattellae TaxID=3233337 RepID=UPI00355BE4F4